ncbi:MAG: flagellar export protein FliJ [Spirochaetia bacterium]|jgi:flagellar FliJ protein|nr:flagellar export protein FliJ [Spirochaetia bacterium]
MKRYSFRLERLLQLRRHEERRWEIRLAEITGACVRLENHIRRLQGEKDKYAGFCEGGELYPISEILVREGFRGRLDSEIEETGEELGLARRKREEVNRAYLDASRARKVLDKLKERRAGEYYEEQRRQERKIMDETAVSRMVFADGEGGE